VRVVVVSRIAPCVSATARYVVGVIGIMTEMVRLRTSVCVCVQTALAAVRKGA
jgi:hypothetical protein